MTLKMEEKHPVKEPMIALINVSLFLAYIQVYIGNIRYKEDT